MASPSTIPPASFGVGGISLRRVAVGTLLVMLVVLGFVLLLQLRDVIVAIFLGILLATALRPIADGLRRIKVSRHLAAFGAVLLLFVFGIGALMLIVPTFVEQGQRLIQEIPVFYADMRQMLVSSPYRVVNQFGISLSPIISVDLQTLAGNAISQFATLLPQLGQGAVLLLGIVLFTYYWLVYRQRSITGLLLLLPEERRKPTEALWLQIEDKIGAFIRGQALLGIVVGLLSLVGYWVIGMPYTLLLGLIAGLLELVPYLGPIITAVFAAIIGFTVSPELGLASLVVAIVVQQIENAVLVPRIMDSAVGVSPVVTLLAIVGFGALFGLSGAFLAIPLAAVLQVLFQYWVQWSERVTTEEGVQGRGPFSLLRYQLLDLVQDVRLRLRNKDEDISSVTEDPEEDLELLLADFNELLTKLEAEHQSA